MVDGEGKGEGAGYAIFDPRPSTLDPRPSTLYQQWAQVVVEEDAVGIEAAADSGEAVQEREDSLHLVRLEEFKRAPVRTAVELPKDLLGLPEELPVRSLGRVVDTDCDRVFALRHAQKSVLGRVGAELDCPLYLGVARQ